MNDIEAHRAKKAAKCCFCGESAHVAEYRCPRIRSVIFYNDTDSEDWDRVEVTFWDDDEPMLAG